MVAVTSYFVGVDWNNDGDYSDTGENVSTDIMSDSAVAIAYGRDTARALSPTMAGTGAFELRNDTLKYSPDNAGSAMYGNLVPGRPVIVQATYGGTTYTLFHGFIDDYTVLPSKSDQKVQVSCIDQIARFAYVQISTYLYQGVRTGTAVGHILDAVGWTGGRDLDPGATYIRWWWEQGTDALTALNKLIGAEGPPAICFIDGATGNFCFRDRHHRLLRTVSNTSQATFHGTTTEPIISEPVTYDAGWKNIVNQVQVTCTAYDPAATTVIWSSSGNVGATVDPETGTPVIAGAITNTITIADSSTYTITAVANGPFTGAAAPLAGIDFQQVYGTTTASISWNSGLAVTITLTDAGGGSAITGLQMRGNLINTTYQIQLTNQDNTSIAEYGVRGLSGVDMSWCGPDDAAAISTLLLNRYAQRRPIITFALNNVSATRLTQLLARDLSDRITVIINNLDFNADCFIETIGYSISNGQTLITATFGCEKAPTDSANAQTNPFTFDAATNGKFNTGAFGW